MSETRTYHLVVELPVHRAEPFVFKQVIAEDRWGQLHEARIAHVSEEGMRNPVSNAVWAPKPERY